MSVPIRRQVVISHTPSGKNLVRTDQSGWLWCIICAQDWCDHVRAAIAGNRDGAALWSELLTEPAGHIQTVVPHGLAPHGRFVATIALRSRDPDTALVKFDQRPLGWITPGFSNSLGTLSNPEGRVVISHMANAWLQAQWEYFLVMDEPRARTGQLPCESRTHDVARQVALEHKLKSTPKGHQKNFWTVVFYEMCLLCYNESMTSKPSFDPDLIPTT